MELPVPNSSMQHPDPDLEIDDMHIILKGASCTIAAVDPFTVALGSLLENNFLSFNTL
jgi:hypothetical protein